MRRQYRETLQGSSVGLENVQMVGRTRLRKATSAGLGEHRHESALELCVVVGGSVRWWAGSSRYTVTGGQCYLTRPGEPHGGENKVLHPCQLLWIIMNTQESQQLASHARPDDRAQLVAALGHSRRRVFPSSPFFESCFDRLFVASRHRGLLRRAMAGAAFDSLLAEAVRLVRRGVPGVDDANVSELVSRAQRWMMGRLDEPIRIADAASHVSLGVSRFHERFVAETGLTPADWLARRRITLARQLLDDPSLTITEIAMRCGYSSSQYFATAFKRLEGITPSRYRART